MAPQLYGWQHILYLAITITLMTALWITIKKCARSERAVRIAVKLTALALLAMILWNRWSICYYRDGFAYFLPQSFCGFSSLALALSVLLLPKDSAVLHCVTYVSILGGTVTMFYPDFIGQNESFLYPMTISGMLHHTVAVFLGVSLIMTGYLVPRLKKWVYLPLGLCVHSLRNAAYNRARVFRRHAALHPSYRRNGFNLVFYRIPVLSAAFRLPVCMGKAEKTKPRARKSRVRNNVNEYLQVTRNNCAGHFIFCSNGLTFMEKLV